MRRIWTCGEEGSCPRKQRKKAARGFEDETGGDFSDLVRELLENTYGLSA